MAELSFPVGDGQNNAADAFQILGLAWGHDGVREGLAASLAGGRSVNVSTGLASCGGFGYRNTSTLTVTSGAETSANPRIDRLVLALNWSTLQVRAQIISGTAAVSPTPPALVRQYAGTWMVPLARWTVPGGSGANITGLVLENGYPIRQEVAESGVSGASVTAGLTVTLADRTITTIGPAEVECATTVYLTCAGAASGQVLTSHGGKVSTEFWHTSAAGPLPVSVSWRGSKAAAEAVAFRVQVYSDPGSSAAVTVGRVNTLIRERV